MQNINETLSCFIFDLTGITRSRMSKACLLPTNIEAELDKYYTLFVA